MDTHQMKVPRHSVGRVYELKANLERETVGGLTLLTTEQTFELLDPIIKDKISQGTSWPLLQAWFKQQGFADLTAVAYQSWSREKRVEKIRGAMK